MRKSPRKWNKKKNMENMRKKIIREPTFRKKKPNIQKE